MFTHCELLPPATKLGQGNIFRSVYQEFCSGGGSPGLHPRGRLRDLVGGVSRPTPKGRLRGLAGRGFSRPTPGGCPGPGGVSQHALRQTPPKQMATAAGSMHPTGMHSCFFFNRALLVTELVSVQMIVFGLR